MLHDLHFSSSSILIIALSSLAVLYLKRAFDKMRDKSRRIHWSLKERTTDNKRFMLLIRSCFETNFCTRKLFACLFQWKMPKHLGVCICKRHLGVTECFCELVWCFGVIWLRSSYFHQLSRDQNRYLVTVNIFLFYII